MARPLLVVDSPASWMKNVHTPDADRESMSRLVQTVLSSTLYQGRPSPTEMRKAAAEQSANPFLRQREKSVSIEPASLSGVNAEWLVPDCDNDQFLILYFHGGGFVRGSLNLGRGIASHLAKATHCRVCAVAYRQAPEHPFPSALEDTRAAYLRLLATGISNKKLIVAGDSAGGTLAISLALSLRDDGLPLPAGVIATSPLTDFTLGGSSYESSIGKDFVTREFAKYLAELYLGSVAPTLSSVSPLFANLSGLPRMLLLVGDDEALRSDAEDFAYKASQQDVDVVLQCYMGMPHVFPSFATRTGDFAFEEMAKWIMY